MQLEINVKLYVVNGQCIYNSEFSNLIGFINSCIFISINSEYIISYY